MFDEDKKDDFNSIFEELINSNKFVDFALPSDVKIADIDYKTALEDQTRKINLFDNIVGVLKDKIPEEYKGIYSELFDFARYKMDVQRRIYENNLNKQIIADIEKVKDEKSGYWDNSNKYLRNIVYNKLGELDSSLTEENKRILVDYYMDLLLNRANSNRSIMDISKDYLKYTDIDARKLKLVWDLPRHSLSDEVIEGIKSVDSKYKAKPTEVPEINWLKSLIEDDNLYPNIFKSDYEINKNSRIRAYTQLFFNELKRDTYQNFSKLAYSLYQAYRDKSFSNIGEVYRAITTNELKKTNEFINKYNLDNTLADVMSASAQLLSVPLTFLTYSFPVTGSIMLGSYILPKATEVGALAYDDALKRGLDNVRAAFRGIAYALAEGGVEALPLEAMPLGNLGVKTIPKLILKSVLTSALGEAVEEGLTNVIQNAVDLSLRINDNTLLSFLGDTLYQMFLGGVGGFTGGAVTHTMLLGKYGINSFLDRTNREIPYTINKSLNNLEISVLKDPNSDYYQKANIGNININIRYENDYDETLERISNYLNTIQTEDGFVISFKKLVDDLINDKNTTGEYDKNNINAFEQFIKSKELSGILKKSNLHTGRLTSGRNIIIEDEYGVRPIKEVDIVINKLLFNSSILEGSQFEVLKFFKDQRNALSHEIAHLLLNNMTKEDKKAFYNNVISTTPNFWEKVATKIRAIYGNNEITNAYVEDAIRLIASNSDLMYEDLDALPPEERNRISVIQGAMQDIVINNSFVPLFNNAINNYNFALYTGAKDLLTFFRKSTYNALINGKKANIDYDIISSKIATGETDILDPKYNLSVNPNETIAVAYNVMKRFLSAGNDAIEANLDDEVVYTKLTKAYEVLDTFYTYFKTNNIKLPAPFNKFNFYALTNYKLLDKKIEDISELIKELITPIRIDYQGEQGEIVENFKNLYGNLAKITNEFSNLMYIMSFVNPDYFKASSERVSSIFVEAFENIPKIVEGIVNDLNNLNYLIKPEDIEKILLNTELITNFYKVLDSVITNARRVANGELLVMKSNFTNYLDDNVSDIPDSILKSNQKIIELLNKSKQKIEEVAVESNKLKEQHDKLAEIFTSFIIRNEDAQEFYELFKGNKNIFLYDSEDLHYLNIISLLLNLEEQDLETIIDKVSNENIKRAIVQTLSEIVDKIKTGEIYVRQEGELIEGLVDEIEEEGAIEDTIEDIEGKQIIVNFGNSEIIHELFSTKFVKDELKKIKKEEKEIKGKEVETEEQVQTTKEEISKEAKQKETTATKEETVQPTVTTTTEETTKVETTPVEKSKIGLSEKEDNAEKKAEELRKNKVELESLYNDFGIGIGVNALLPTKEIVKTPPELKPKKVQKAQTESVEEEKENIQEVSEQDTAKVKKEVEVVVEEEQPQKTSKTKSKKPATNIVEGKNTTSENIEVEVKKVNLNSIKIDGFDKILETIEDYSKFENAEVVPAKAYFIRNEDKLQYFMNELSKVLTKYKEEKADVKEDIIAISLSIHKLKGNTEIDELVKEVKDKYDNVETLKNILKHLENILETTKVKEKLVPRKSKNDDISKKKTKDNYCIFAPEDFTGKSVVVTNMKPTDDLIFFNPFSFSNYVSLDDIDEIEKILRGYYENERINKARLKNIINSIRELIDDTYSEEYGIKYSLSEQTLEKIEETLSEKHNIAITQRVSDIITKDFKDYLEKYNIGSTAKSDILKNLDDKLSEISSLIENKKIKSVKSNNIIRNIKELIEETYLEEYEIRYSFSKQALKEIEETLSSLVGKEDNTTIVLKVSNIIIKDFKEYLELYDIGSIAKRDIFKNLGRKLSKISSLMEFENEEIKSKDIINRLRELIEGTYSGKYKIKYSFSENALEEIKETLLDLIGKEHNIIIAQKVNDIITEDFKEYLKKHDIGSKTRSNILNSLAHRLPDILSIISNENVDIVSDLMELGIYNKNTLIEDAIIYIANVLNDYKINQGSNYSMKYAAKAKSRIDDIFPILVENLMKYEKEKTDNDTPMKRLPFVYGIFALANDIYRRGIDFYEFYEKRIKNINVIPETDNVIFNGRMYKLIKLIHRIDITISGDKSKGGYKYDTELFMKSIIHTLYHMLKMKALESGINKEIYSSNIEKYTENIKYLQELLKKKKITESERKRIESTIENYENLIKTYNIFIANNEIIIHDAKGLDNIINKIVDKIVEYNIKIKGIYDIDNILWDNHEVVYKTGETKKTGYTFPAIMYQIPLAIFKEFQTTNRYVRRLSDSNILFADTSRGNIKELTGTESLMYVFADERNTEMANKSFNIVRIGFIRNIYENLDSPLNIKRMDLNTFEKTLITLIYIFDNIISKRNNSDKEFETLSECIEEIKQASELDDFKFGINILITHFIKFVSDHYEYSQASNSKEEYNEVIRKLGNELKKYYETSKDKNIDLLINNLPVFSTVKKLFNEKYLDNVSKNIENIFIKYSESKIKNSITDIFGVDLVDLFNKIVFYIVDNTARLGIRARPDINIKKLERYFRLTKETGAIRAFGAERVFDNEILLNSKNYWNVVTSGTPYSILSLVHYLKNKYKYVNYSAKELEPLNDPEVFCDKTSKQIDAILNKEKELKDIKDINEFAYRIFYNKLANSDSPISAIYKKIFNGKDVNIKDKEYRFICMIKGFLNAVKLSFQHKDLSEIDHETLKNTIMEWVNNYTPNSKELEEKLKYILSKPEVISEYMLYPVFSGVDNKVMIVGKILDSILNNVTDEDSYYRLFSFYKNALIYWKEQNKIDETTYDLDAYGIGQTVETLLSKGTLNKFEHFAHAIARMFFNTYFMKTTKQGTIYNKDKVLPEIKPGKEGIYDVEFSKKIVILYRHLEGRLKEDTNYKKLVNANDKEYYEDMINMMIDYAKVKDINLLRNKSDSNLEIRKEIEQIVIPYYEEVKKYFIGEKYQMDYIKAKNLASFMVDCANGMFLSGTDFMFLGNYNPFNDILFKLFGITNEANSINKEYTKHGEVIQFLSVISNNKFNVSPKFIDKSSKLLGKIEKSVGIKNLYFSLFDDYSTKEISELNKPSDFNTVHKKLQQLVPYDKSKNESVFIKFFNYAFGKKDISKKDVEQLKSISKKSPLVFYKKEKIEAKSTSKVEEPTEIEVLETPSQEEIVQTTEPIHKREPIVTKSDIQATEVSKNIITKVPEGVSIKSLPTSKLVELYYSPIATDTKVGIVREIASRATLSGLRIGNEVARYVELTATPNKTSKELIACLKNMRENLYDMIARMTIASEAGKILQSFVGHMKNENLMKRVNINVKDLEEYISELKTTPPKNIIQNYNTFFNTLIDIYSFMPLGVEKHLQRGFSDNENDVNQLSSEEIKKLGSILNQMNFYMNVIEDVIQNIERNLSKSEESIINEYIKEHITGEVLGGILMVRKEIGLDKLNELLAIGVDMGLATDVIDMLDKLTESKLDFNDLIKYGIEVRAKMYEHSNFNDILYGYYVNSLLSGYVTLFKNMSGFTYGVFRFANQHLVGLLNSMFGNRVGDYNIMDVLMRDRLLFTNLSMKFFDLLYKNMKISFITRASAIKMRITRSLTDPTLPEYEKLPFVSIGKTRTTKFLWKFLTYPTALAYMIDEAVKTTFGFWEAVNYSVAEARKLGLTNTSDIYEYVNNDLFLSEDTEKYKGVIINPESASWLKAMREMDVVTYINRFDHEAVNRWHSKIKYQMGLKWLIPFTTVFANMMKISARNSIIGTLYSTMRYTPVIIQGLLYGKENVGVTYEGEEIVIKNIGNTPPEALKRLSESLLGFLFTYLLSTYILGYSNKDGILFTKAPIGSMRPIVPEGSIIINNNNKYEVVYVKEMEPFYQSIVINNLIMNLVSKLKERYDEGTLSTRDLYNVIKPFASSLINEFTDFGAFRTIHDVDMLIGNPFANATHWAINYLSGFIPNIAKQTNKVLISDYQYFSKTKSILTRNAPYDLLRSVTQLLPDKSRDIVIDMFGLPARNKYGRDVLERIFNITSIAFKPIRLDYSDIEQYDIKYTKLITEAFYNTGDNPFYAYPNDKITINSSDKDKFDKIYVDISPLHLKEMMSTTGQLFLYTLMKYEEILKKETGDEHIFETLVKDNPEKFVSIVDNIHRKISQKVTNTVKELYIPFIPEEIKRTYKEGKYPKILNLNSPLELEGKLLGLEKMFEVYPTIYKLYYE